MRHGRIPRATFYRNATSVTCSRTRQRLATDVLRAVGDLEAVEVALCPPFVHLADVADILRDSRVALGAQNLHGKDAGATPGYGARPVTIS